MDLREKLSINGRPSGVEEIASVFFKIPRGERGLCTAASPSVMTDFALKSLPAFFPSWEELSIRLGSMASDSASSTRPSGAWGRSSSDGSGLNLENPSEEWIARDSWVPVKLGSL